MKKVSFALTVAAAVAFAGSAAFAGDSDTFFDIRDNSGGIQDITGTPAAPFTFGQDVNGTATNGGGLGEGQILRLSPVHANNYHTNAGFAYPNFDGDNDLSTGQLVLYTTVNDRTGGGDVISSIGVDIKTQDSVATANNGTGTRIGAMSQTWTNTGVWSASGTVDGASDLADPPNVDGAKAVQVAVAAGPVYDPTGGLEPGAGPQEIARVNVTAGNCVAGSTVANSTYEVFLQVNNLLYTRTFNPATPGDGSPEMVSFGYDSLGQNYAAGAGNVDAAVSGSLDGASSALPDAVVRIQVKGDGNGSYSITGADVPALSALLSGALAPAQQWIYLYDFNNSGTITGADIPAFSAILSGGLPGPTCP
ncbi:MAG: hypothetical protein MI923_10195 [Phycisphaerales bacterium]|nr:hypothetical protein [Phycisphaerales bacterium]